MSQVSDSEYDFEKKFDATLESFSQGLERNREYLAKLSKEQREKSEAESKYRLLKLTTELEKEARENDARVKRTFNIRIVSIVFMFVVANYLIFSH